MCPAGVPSAPAGHFIFHQEILVWMGRRPLLWTKPINICQIDQGRVWALLQKSNRIPEEEDEMLHAANACTYHWKFVGTAVHQQRGEWLISCVHLVLGHAQEALRHAERCFQLPVSHPGEMADFDIAYAYEGLARAHALSRNFKKAENYYHRAYKTGESIQD
jgi:hypothetical protein